MTFMGTHKAGGISGAKTVFIYERPIESVNQESFTVDGIYDPQIIRFERYIDYILDWVWETDRESVIEQIYDRDSLEARDYPGYKIMGAPVWEFIETGYRFPMFIGRLTFYKSSNKREDLSL